MTVEIRHVAWPQFSPDLLHDYLRLRSEVFVVEQNCVYADMDGLDPFCQHLLALQNDKVVGGLRMLPPDLKYVGCSSLGRLITSASVRGQGVAEQLVAQGLQALQTQYPDHPVRISGQRYLESFYTRMGFITEGAPYLEDGIPHVEMVLQWPSVPT
jgi:ElaA protein